MTRLTDVQLRDAFYRAARRAPFDKIILSGSSRTVLDGEELNELRLLAEELDQSSGDELDWQECAFEDIRIGDLVKAVRHNGDYMVFTAEATTPLSVYGEDWHVSHPADEVLYRIPVKTPDPSEHPAIVVINADGYDGEEPAVLVWTGLVYENRLWAFDQHRITEWKPIDIAKVIADD